MNRVWDELQNFEDLAFLWTCDNRNRGIVRLNFEEAALCWKVVKATSGRILEIGRRHGGSTILLATAATPSRQLTSVDITPAHSPAVDALTAQGASINRISLAVEDSRKPVGEERYGMLFIDGDHSLRGVLLDTIAHWDKLDASEGDPNNLLAVFNDALPNDGLADRIERSLNYCGGIKLVVDLLQEDGVSTEWGRAGSVLVLRKHKALPRDFEKRVLSRASAIGMHMVDKHM